MIVVLDTNVLISTLLSTEGPPAQIIEHWEGGVFDVATSGPLLDELKRALGYERLRKFIEMTPEEINTLLRGWRSTAIFVSPKMELDIVGDNPDVNRVLECAVSAGAKYILSGDDHLLDLGEYRGIEILPPAGFVGFLNM